MSTTERLEPDQKSTTLGRPVTGSE